MKLAIGFLAAVLASTVALPSQAQSALVHLVCTYKTSTPENGTKIDIRFNSDTGLIEYGANRQQSAGKISDSEIAITPIQGNPTGWYIDRMNGTFKFVMENPQRPGVWVEIPQGTCAPVTAKKF